MSSTSMKVEDENQKEGTDATSTPTIETLKLSCDKEPTNFSNWVKYLAEAEKVTDFAVGSLAFETFLSLFPLCYGYWEKFAAYARKTFFEDKNIPAKKEPWNRVRDIYERGVAAISTSVDMWINYLAFVEHYSPDGMKKDEAERLRRSLFDRAARNCGTDPGAGMLWNKYITFEQQSQHGGDASVCKLYYRITTLVWQGATQYWQLYLEILQQCALEFIATSDEIKRIQAEIEASRSDEVDGNEDSSVESSKGKGNVGSDVQDDAFIRAKIIEKRTAEHATAASEAYKRSIFEQRIKRSYYHIKVLDDAQIANWDAYLTFEESENAKKSPVTVERLYERCLVPCANMPRFWIRYVRWRESVGMPIEVVEETFARACSTFVKNLPEMHMERALWYESQGDMEKADRTYVNLTSNVAPGLLEAILRFANFKRRCGHAVQGEMLLADAAKATSDDASKAFLCLQRGNYMRATKADASRVVDAYEEAVKVMPSNKLAWATLLRYLASIERIYCDGEKDGSKASVSSVFDKILAESSLVVSDKAELWQLRLCLEEDRGSNVDTFRTLRMECDVWTRSNSSSIARGRNRNASSAASSSMHASYANEAPSHAKRARVESDAAISVTSASNVAGGYWVSQARYDRGAYTAVPTDGSQYAASHSQGAYAPHGNFGSAYTAGAYGHGGYYGY